MVRNCRLRRARPTARTITRTLKTNATGSYIAPELRSGSYSVKAEAPGFKTYERTSTKLDSNDTVRVDAHLEVGQVSESVTVASEAVKVEIGFERDKRLGVR